MDCVEQQPVNFCPDTASNPSSDFESVGPVVEPCGAINQKADSSSLSNASYFKMTVQDLIQQGNRLKLQKKWKQAGDAFLIAANRLASNSNDEFYQQADCYQTAADCYRKVNLQHAVLCLEQAEKLYSQLGQFSIAASLLETAGEIAERINNVRKHPSVKNSLDESHEDAEFNDFEFVTVAQNSLEAIKYYRKAADYFSSESRLASASNCLTKVAICLAELANYSEAAEEFEKLGVAVQGDELLEFGASDYMFKSCLCLLSNEKLQKLCSAKADELAQKCTLFDGSDQFQLVKSMANALESGDVDAFEAAIEKFGRFNNLDEFDERRLGEARRSLESRTSSTSGTLLT